MSLILILLTLVSGIYWILAWWTVRSFFHSCRAGPSDYTPPVSVLKPVKGLDPEMYENFASFCQQDYPEYEILFGVMDPDDPAVPLIHRLQEAYPERSIRLVIAPPLGTNNKASILHALAKEARHNLLVASDSDMRVRPDYLRRVVAPLADPQVGLVTCLLRGVKARSPGAVMEALEIGTCFLPPALMGLHVFKMSYAFGASIALRRETLERMGGFAAVADYLADDYQIGARIGALGRRVVLSDYLMDNVLGDMPMDEVWDRYVRWLRCARVSRPREYIPMAITFTIPLALLTLLWLGFSAAGWLLFMESLLIRVWSVWHITRYTDDREVRRNLLWLPAGDLLHAAYWAAALVGRRVVWRGEAFEVDREGRLVPEHSRPLLS